MAAKYSPLRKDEATRDNDILSDTETDLEIDGSLKRKVSKAKMSWSCLKALLVVVLSILSVSSILAFGFRAVLHSSSGERILPTPRRQS